MSGRYPEQPSQDISIAGSDSAKNIQIGCSLVESVRTEYPKFLIENLA